MKTSYTYFDRITNKKVSASYVFSRETFLLWNGLIYEDCLLTMNEAVLIQRAKAGDTTAFETLVLAHQDFVYNLALRTLGNSFEAEDVAQDAFVRAWLALPKFRQNARFRTWIYRIVVNLCYNRFPRLRRELVLLVDEDIADIPDASEEASPVLRDEMDAQRAYLHSQIDGLPDQYRMLISLRYQDELSYKEIATITELPLGTVKTGLFRAKELLRQALLEPEEMN
jgi:RNA polymerase sigma-70 factor (ECF subfamily)